MMSKERGLLEDVGYNAEDFQRAEEVWARLVEEGKGRYKWWLSMVRQEWRQEDAEIDQELERILSSGSWGYILDWEEQQIQSRREQIRDRRGKDAKRRADEIRDGVSARFKLWRQLVLDNR